MREHPILFSAEMIKAILAGRKTQTRRIVQPQPLANCEADSVEAGDVAWHEGKLQKLCRYAKGSGRDAAGELFMRPFVKYAIGERLWVRETWCSPSQNVVGYKADAECGAWMDDGAGGRIWNHHGIILESPAYESRFENDQRWTTYGLAKYGAKWRSPRFMPRWASRITLEITGVKVERLQDISLDDAVAEGVEGVEDGEVFFNFISLWESINGKGSWSENHFVWAISFRRIEQVAPNSSGGAYRRLHTAHNPVVVIPQQDYRRMKLIQEGTPRIEIGL